MIFLVFSDYDLIEILIKCLLRLWREQNINNTVLSLLDLISQLVIYER